MNNQTWHNHSKPILNTFTIVLAKFFQKYKPFMIRVCCYLKGDLHRNILNTNHFLDIFAGWDIGTTFLIFHQFAAYFHVFSNLKGRKKQNNEDLGNTFETMVTLISKWRGISKIYPPILDYRILSVLRNDLLVPVVSLNQLGL